MHDHEEDSCSVKRRSSVSYFKYCDNYAKALIFEHGGHPAMNSNIDEFVRICDSFFES